MQEGQGAGGGEDGDGDGEVEDGGALAQGGAAGLGRAGGGGQHLRLELQQLPHEAEVWRDDAAPLLDELEGLVQAHAVGPHQVRQADGGGARDSRLAVHEDAAAGVPHGV